MRRRKRPGFFRVEPPRQLSWHLELRCRADEAIALVERAAALYAIEPGELTLGSDNGSAVSARR